MKKSIIYILFALFSFSAAVSLTACKDDGVEISDAYKSKTPKNVKLLEYGKRHPIRSPAGPTAPTKARLRWSKRSTARPARSTS